MSSPPDVIEPVPMQVEIKSEEEPKKKETKPASVSVTQDKEKIEVKVKQSTEEEKAINAAKLIAEQAKNPENRKDAKQTLDKAKRNR